MDRRNVLLSAILVLQLVLVAFFFWPSGAGNAAVNALLPELSADAITGVTIQGDDRTLELAQAGDGWVLTNYGDFPVDATKVTDLISKTLAIDTSRLVARTAASHTRLQVDSEEFAKKVELTTADGQTQTVIVGSSPSVRATNVRLGDSDLVYLTDKVTGSEIRTDVAGWGNMAYLQVPNDQPTALTISNANGTLTFTEVSTDTWTLDDLAVGEVFNQNNFSTVLTRLSSLNMSEPVGKEAKPEFGLETPSATVTVTTSEKSITLVIGAKDEGGTNYYAKSSDSEFYVKIATFTGDQFVNDTRDRYLQPPPTPEASSGITDTTGITTTLPLTELSAFPTTFGVTPTVEVTATEALTPTDEVTATTPTTP
jgi:hypothetical protein